ncbi:MAG TPA: transglutaminase domain-containing protein, partial [Terriglobales bacterium]
DGTIAEFTGKPFEKVVVKSRGIKFLAKTFTFPQVTVGSILEYRYVLNTPINRVFIFSEWSVQHDLFTVKENLTMTPYLEGLQGFMTGYQVSMVSTNLSKDMKLTKKGRGWELDVQNLPAFQSESYMPPENNYKPEVRFFYIKYQPDSDDRYWNDLGKALYEETEHFIGNHGDVKEAALATVGTETTPEGKLRRLYDRVQQIRNLSFERERSEEERKKEALKENENVGDVLSHGYGEHNDINRLYVAMARAAGFGASILAASDRKEGFFAKSLLSRSLVEKEIVVVKLNDSDLYLDPGTKFCPFKLLPWEQTSTQALKLDKRGGELVLVPPATQDKAVVKRLVNARLDSEGAFKGEIAVQYQGGEALERRLTALKTDEAGKNKMLEDELKEWLPSGAVVKLTDARNWESSEEPLTATFEVELPGYASLAGKRLLIPSYLFQTRQVGTFKQSERKFPVYFPYAFSELDQITISIPAGYSAESVPLQQDAGLPYARYQLRSQVAGSQLVTHRTLLFNGIFFPLERYPELRGFFNKVQSGDEQQTVMQGGSPNVQKGN